MKHCTEKNSRLEVCNVTQAWKETVNYMQDTISVSNLKDRNHFRLTKEIKAETAF